MLAGEEEVDVSGRDAGGVVTGDEGGGSGAGVGDAGGDGAGVGVGCGEAWCTGLGFNGRAAVNCGAGFAVVGEVRDA